MAGAGRDVTFRIGVDVAQGAKASIEQLRGSAADLRKEVAAADSQLRAMSRATPAKATAATPYHQQIAGAATADYTPAQRPVSASQNARRALESSQSVPAPAYVPTDPQEKFWRDLLDPKNMARDFERSAAARGKPPVNIPTAETGQFSAFDLGPVGTGESYDAGSQQSVFGPFPQQKISRPATAQDRRRSRWNTEGMTFPDSPPAARLPPPLPARSPPMDKEALANLTKEANKANKAINDAEKAAARANAEIKGSMNGMAESFGRVTEGSMKLTRGFVLLGLSGEDDIEKVVKELAKVQAAIDITRGGIDTVRGLVKGFSDLNSVFAAKAKLSDIEAASQARAATAGRAQQALLAREAAAANAAAAAHQRLAAARGAGGAAATVARGNVVASLVGAGGTGVAAGGGGGAAAAGGSLAGPIAAAAAGILAAAYSIKEFVVSINEAGFRGGAREGTTFDSIAKTQAGIFGHVEVMWQDFAKSLGIGEKSLAKFAASLTSVLPSSGLLTSTFAALGLSGGDYAKAIRGAAEAARLEEKFRKSLIAERRKDEYAVAEASKKSDLFGIADASRREILAVRAETFQPEDTQTRALNIQRRQRDAENALRLLPRGADDPVMGRRLRNERDEAARMARDFDETTLSSDLQRRRQSNAESIQSEQRQLKAARIAESQAKTVQDRELATKRIGDLEQTISKLDRERFQIERQTTEERLRGSQRAVDAVNAEIQGHREILKTISDQKNAALESFGQKSLPDQVRQMRAMQKAEELGNKSLSITELGQYRALRGQADAGMKLREDDEKKLAALEAKRREGAAKAVAAPAPQLTQQEANRLQSLRRRQDAGNETDVQREDRRTLEAKAEMAGKMRDSWSQQEISDLKGSGIAKYQEIGKRASEEKGLRGMGRFAGTAFSEGEDLSREKRGAIARLGVELRDRRKVDITVQSDREGEGALADELVARVLKAIGDRDKLLAEAVEKRFGETLRKSDAAMSNRNRQ